MLVLNVAITEYNVIFNGCGAKTSCFSSFPAPCLSLNERADVLEDILASSTRWYEIGLRLKFSVDKLDGITSQFSDPRHCLREMLKEWLKGAARSRPTWGGLVEALRSQTVGEPELADQLEAKHCQSERMSKGSCILKGPYVVSYSLIIHSSLTQSGERSGYMATYLCYSYACRLLVCMPDYDIISIKLGRSSSGQSA